MYKRQVRRVFLVGGGKISLYLAILLEKMQMQVKIVELSEARCRFLSELLPHSTIICGDGTDQELLDSENLSSCCLLYTSILLCLSMFLFLERRSAGPSHASLKGRADP